MGDEPFQNDTVYQRNYYLPTPIVMKNGVVTIPAGSILDARLATVELNGQFLDQITGENIVQGRSLTNPNTVDDTDVTRSLLVSSYNTSLTDGHGNSLLSDDTCSISSTGTSDSITFSKVTGSTNSYLLNTTTGTILNCDIENSNASYIRNTGSNNLQRCAVRESDGSYINAGNGQIMECNLNSTEACSISSGSGNVTISEISNSGLCSISASVGSLNENKIDGSQSCTIQNNQSLFPFQKNTIIGSGGCNINANIPGSFGGNAIVHCSTCNCLGTECLIAASVSSNITATSSNSQAYQAAILASEACSISPILNRAGDCGIIGGYTTTFGTNAVRTVAAGIQFSGASNCDRCFMTGYGNSINGFNDVATFGGTATSSEQIITNRRIDMTGTGKNFTNSGGYSYPGTGTLSTLVKTNLLNNTLVSASETYLFDTNNRNIILPAASSMSANYPLNTTKEWVIMNHAYGPAVVNINYVRTSGTDTFNNIPGWTAQILDRNGYAYRIIFVNDSVTPYWAFSQTIKQFCDVFAPTNSFGVSPPKSDAAQLPTSTSQATHEALGAPGLVTFTSMATNNSETFYSISDPLLPAYGVLVKIPGYYVIKLLVTVQTVSGGSFYLIRANIATNTTGNVNNSYSEKSGNNDGSGTDTIVYKTPPTYINANTNVTIKLSQDATRLINASASILKCRMTITGYF